MHTWWVSRVSGKTDQRKLLHGLGMTIRAQRKALGFSQEASADAAEIDRSHMGKIERGERNVTLLNLIRTAQALDRNASQILADAGL